MTTTNIKIKGVKNAISNYKQCDNRNLFPIFYLNMSTGSVWCNIYTSRNSWTQYQNENIVCVHPYQFISCQDGVSMKTLRLACEKTIEYYKTERK